MKYYKQIYLQESQYSVVSSFIDSGAGLVLSTYCNLGNFHVKNIHVINFQFD